MGSEAVQKMDEHIMRCVEELHTIKDPAKLEEMQKHISWCIVNRNTLLEAETKYTEAGNKAKREKSKEAGAATMEVLKLASGIAVVVCAIEADNIGKFVSKTGLNLATKRLFN